MTIPNYLNRSGFHDDLRALDGQYGPLEYNPASTIISNDEGYADIAPAMLRELPKRRNDLGLFIGGGGLISMLPELPVHTIMSVDKNTFMGDLNGWMTGLILDADTPENVLDHINDEWEAPQSEVIKSVREAFGGINLVGPMLTNESRNYGPYHWTVPERFQVVQKALRRKTLINVNADISNPEFSRALAKTLDSYDRRIVVANLTNVHAWIEHTTMDFVREWPFGEQVIILYSDHDEDTLVGGLPRQRYTTSTEEYIAATSVKNTF